MITCKKSCVQGEEEASERLKEVEEELHNFRDGSLESDDARNAVQERLQAKLRMIEQMV